MKLTHLTAIAAALTLAGCAAPAAPDVDADEALAYCHQKVTRALAELCRDSADYTMMPRNIARGDSAWHCRRAVASEWCSGFWPGILWYTYEATGDTAVRREAERYTAALEHIARQPAHDHDLGFLMHCSFGNAYRLTGEQRYKEAVLAAADTLATLFNPRVGTILSWPYHVERYGGHNTIIDNMLNLEMLFWAANNGGDARLRDIAVSHAATTMRHHFRADGSSYHVAVYDPATGQPLKGVTKQGYSDASTWARGQAWAVYGFTMAFRETANEQFRDFACKVADVYLSRLPADRVPYWDFDDPAIPNAPRDASAAAIVASALLELQGYCSGAQALRYRQEAIAMLAALGSDSYRAPAASCAFVDHCTGDMPANSEIDCSLVYADYYYIEALLRLKKLRSQPSGAGAGKS